MGRDEFLSLLKSDTAAKLARQFLLADNVAVFADPALYAAFKRRVAAVFDST